MKMINLFRKRTGAKLSLVLLSIFLFLLLFAPSASAAMMGDIDDSGSINVLDVVLAKQHVLGLQLLTPAQKLVADVNGSGDVDVLDVDLIMRKTLGLITEFPFVQLQVSSVTAVNARQVEVVFNAAVTKSLAENPANYEVYKQGALFTNVFGTAVNGAVSALQADGRTVLLTLNEGPPKQVLFSGSNFNRVVVKAAVGLAADYTNNSVAFLDTTAPTFQSVRSISANTIELTFSEPVRADPNVAGLTLTDGIGPVILLPGTALFNDAKRTMTIQTAAALTPGVTYTVVVQTGATNNHLEDYVGLKIVSGSRQFTHIPVVSTPTVTAAAVNEKIVRLTFDRPVSVTPADNNVRFRLNFNIIDATQRSSNDMDGFDDADSTFAKAVVLGSGGTQYDVQFASPLELGSNTIYIHYFINLPGFGKIVDTFDNVLPHNTAVNFTVSATTTPLIVSARTVAVDQIAITYSRPITKNANNPGQFKYGAILGSLIVSNVGNEIVVVFPGAGFSAGVPLPTDVITYEESAISGDRVKDTANPAINALSRDRYVGIAAGF
jgi:methionine-rich copper-binding protein CopC